MKKIVFSQHALDQIYDRGATEKEVKLAIQTGEEAPAKKGRRAFRKNFHFGSKWKDISLKEFVGDFRFR